jgi:ribonuclease R
VSSTRSDRLERRILELLTDRAGRPLKPKEIARELDVSTAEYRGLKDTLHRMTDEGVLYKVKHGRYAPPRKINVAVGRFSFGRHGGGTVTTDDPDAEVVFVPAAQTGTALHGDKVAVRISERRSGPLPEGEIIRVVDRARTTVVGTLFDDGRVAIVRPENHRIPRDVLIPPEALNGAKDQQLVEVRVISWGDPRQMMVGEVAEVLGTPGDPGLDVTIVMKEYDLPLRFPDRVEEAAAKLPDRPSPEDIKGRLDLRELDVVTIDPVDAKDFDDALSIRPLSGDAIEVGVHIADVSHYVRPGDPVDEEGYARATSVYLVDRVVPMLPEALSNRLCSLVPHQDRLAFSVMLRMELDGTVKSAKFAPSVIHSKRRFAYQEVQEILDGRRPAPEDQRFAESLRTLAAISRSLVEKRHARGSLDFDLPASRVILDARGLPIDIQKVERLEAHKLVESFMLLANESVAKRLKQMEVPALYRNHRGPDAMATQELRDMLARHGYKLQIKKGGDLSPRALQKVLHESDGAPESAVISMLVLRSMKRALYEPEPLGHFGLATQNYTHFTSPIRRYPDLVVHRVLKSIVAGERPPVEGSVMAAIGERCSERERVAEEAERASVELKKVQFMLERLGEEFDGRIVGVTAFGFFVEIDDVFVTGLVHVNRLEDDYYIFVEETLSLLGEHTGRAFKLGGRVRVVATHADIARRQIDFELVEEGDEGDPDARRRRRGGRRRSRS